jgi:predicted transcriptional regulator
MSKDTLELLLNSRARVKILKFLFRNMGLTPTFSIKDISSRIQERPSIVRKEIRKLLEIGLLKQKNK